MKYYASIVADGKNQGDFAQLPLKQDATIEDVNKFKETGMYILVDEFAKMAGLKMKIVLVEEIE